MGLAGAGSPDWGDCEGFKLGLGPVGMVEARSPE